MNIMPKAEGFNKSEIILETPADTQTTEALLDRICDLEKQNNELLTRVDRNTFIVAFVSVVSVICSAINVIILLL